MAGRANIEGRDHRVDADRVAHRGEIITRVWADTEKQRDKFGGLTRIGIDEISYKRGHKYLTCVVDHGSGRLVWAAPGPDKAALVKFFEALGPERAAQITHASADGAAWIAAAVAVKCPSANSVRRPIPRREMGDRSP